MGTLVIVTSVETLIELAVLVAVTMAVYVPALA